MSNPFAPLADIDIDSEVRTTQDDMSGCIDRQILSNEFAEEHANKEESDKMGPPLEETVNPSKAEQIKGESFHGKDAERDATCKNVESEVSINNTDLVDPIDIDGFELNNEQVENNKDEEVSPNKTSSTPSVNTSCSQNCEDGGNTIEVSQEDVIQFLDETFRKRHVKIKDFSPDLHAFLKTAKDMVHEPQKMSEPQFQRLRKCTTKAGKELLE